MDQLVALEGSYYHLAKFIEGQGVNGEIEINELVKKQVEIAKEFAFNNFFDFVENCMDGEKNERDKIVNRFSVLDDMKNMLKSLIDHVENMNDINYSIDQIAGNMPPDERYKASINITFRAEKEAEGKND